MNFSNFRAAKEQLMIKNYVFSLLLIFIGSCGMLSQELETAAPVLMGSSRAISAEPLSTKDLVPPKIEYKIYNPRNRGSNIVVPGKGYPKREDAARQKAFGKYPTKSPILNFDAVVSGSTPTDPTGAAGPNHYLNGWNSAFSIYDKEGNLLVPPADLSSIGGTFQGEDLGDPIILYDQVADRFLISQFSRSPNSLLVAISQGPDPVNDGWYTYRFETGDLPDYPKFFLWGDGYYVTTNKNPLAPDRNEVVFVLERDKMLVGEEAQQIGFPLPGINNNGFYSPAGFSAVGEELPPPGNAPILYFQDDSWTGVNEDHLKIWLIDVDWNNLSSSVIRESQTLGGAQGVTPFNSVFDGGSFTNLAQPGDIYSDVDALQGAVMYMTTYRRFPGYNAVVLNFVVDIDPSPAEHAGIRWYELRQSADGEPWTVYQEGTYAPDDSDRWCGTMSIDRNGNIALGFTVMNANSESPVFPSLRYTGRYSGDPLGVMTLRETSIVEGPSPNPSNRYGDYSHLTIDPVDGEVFWYNGEYFVNQSRRNRVATFQLEPTTPTDVGVVEIINPRNKTLGSEEEITVAIWNFGSTAQSNFPVTFSVEGGPTITEIYEGTIPRTSEVEFTFSTTVDLSDAASYTVTARTDLEGDENPENDGTTAIIEYLDPNDVGVTTIDAPVTGRVLNPLENVTVTIQNYGGDAQSDIPVSYTVDGETTVNEVFEGPLAVGEQFTYTFDQGVDISVPGAYIIYARTLLPEDANPENDDAEKIIANLDCVPAGSDCSFGDGIFNFYLGDIINENIPCGTGYIDFIGFSTELDRSVGFIEVGVSSYYASGDDEKFSLWIDFNDNGSFDADELLIDSQVIPTEEEIHTFEFQLPEDAPLGEHILRVRAGDTSYEGNLNNPCSIMDYGTTHDYSVTIIDSGLIIEESVLYDAELATVNRGDNVFDVNLKTEYRETLRITVHNLLGQKLVENKLERSTQGYTYELDMRYVASGIYLVRVGTREVGKVARLMVL